MIYLDIGDEPLETLREAARLISTGEAGFHAMTAGEVILDEEAEPPAQTAAHALEQLALILAAVRSLVRPS